MDQYLLRPWGYFLLELVLRMLSTYAGKGCLVLHFLLEHIFRAG
jgi:hypothetical protein